MALHTGDLDEFCHTLYMRISPAFLRHKEVSVKERLATPFTVWDVPIF